MRKLLIWALALVLVSCSGTINRSSGKGSPVPPSEQLPSLADLDSLPSADRGALAADVPEPGSEFIASFGASQDGTAAVILPGGDDALAWALYRVQGLLDNRPVDLNVSVNSVILPGGDDPLSVEYYVGVSDYTLFRWRWYGPFSTNSGGFNLNSAAERERIISAVGTLHYVILVPPGPGQSQQGGNAVRVETTLVSTETATDQAQYLTTLPHYTPASASLPDGTSALGTASQRNASALDSSQYVTIAWNHIDDDTDTRFEASQYQVYRVPHGGDIDDVGILLDTPTAAQGTNTFVDPTDNGGTAGEAVPGRLYDYYIVALNSAGPGPVIPAGTVLIPLLAPLGLNASDGIYPDYVQLDWSAVEGATEYRLYRDGQPLATVPAPATSYQDDTAIRPTVYSYTVEAATAEAVSPLSAPDTGYRGQWLTMPVDESPVNGGFYISMLQLSDNLLAIAHLEPSPSGTIRFAKASVALPDDASDWTVSAALSPAGPTPLQCDEYSSLLLVNNLPALAAYDNFERRLVFARSDTNTPVSEADWNVHEVDDDDPGSNILGWSLDAAYVGGTPAISYLNASTGILHYAWAGSATPGSTGEWTAYALSPGDSVRYSTALIRLRVGVEDCPAICYYKNSPGQLMWTSADRHDPPNAGSWSTPYVIDTIGSSGSADHISALNRGGFPVVLYRDRANPSLKCATTSLANPASATDWAIHTVDSAGNSGAYASACLVGGKLAVAYYDEAALELRLATARVDSPAAGSDWSISTIDNVDKAGQWCCLVELNGKPAIAYQRSPNDSGDLWFARAE